MAGQSANYALFRDCLSTALLQPRAPSRGSRRRRSRSSRPATPQTLPDSDADADALADFIDYLADGIFSSLPPELQHLDYRSWRESEHLQSLLAPPTADGLSRLNLRLPPAILETLSAYELPSAAVTDAEGHDADADANAFLLPVLAAYLQLLTAPPPATRSSRTDACEMCARSWIPLSYHHLVPRRVHDKAVRRGWHAREDLNNVAWLCGACHRFVHAFRGHEELARRYHTVDLLLADDEVRRFVDWVSRLRWKGGRTSKGSWPSHLMNVLAYMHKRCSIAHATVSFCPDPHIGVSHLSWDRRWYRRCFHDIPT